MVIKISNPKALSTQKTKSHLRESSHQILQKLLLYHNLLESIENPHLENEILERIRDIPSHHSPEEVLEKLRDKEGTKEIIREFLQHSQAKVQKESIEKPVELPKETSVEETSILEDSKIHPFDLFFHEEVSHLRSLDELYQYIAQRRSEIAEQKRHFFPLVEKLRAIYSDFHASFQEVHETGSLKPVSEGAGAAYFLCDERGKPKFIVKPVDEDIFCLNNRKGFVSIQTGYRTRKWVPVYRSAQTDVLCYEVSQIIRTSTVTPKTSMAVLNDEGFYDLSERVGLAYKDGLISKGGHPDKEKLCSVQEYIEDSKDLFEVLNRFQHMKLSDREIEHAFDQTDFEEANLFLWTTYDTDGHFGNFRVYIKGVDPLGREILGIKKVDNGLAFPEQNEQLRNGLVHLPNAKRPLSDSAKEKIRNIDVNVIVNRLRFYEMDECIDAFIERIGILKELAKREGMSIYEINYRMGLIGKGEVGKSLALSPIPLKELKKKVKHLKVNNEGF